MAYMCENFGPERKAMSSIGDIRIAFFDVDGTLLPFRRRDITERTREALNALQVSGVKIVVATGRAPTIVPTFDGVNFDAYLTFNGSYCYTAEGEVVFSNPIPRHAVRAVVENATAIGRPVIVSTVDDLAANGADDDMRAYLDISGEPINIVENLDVVIENNDVYQFSIGATPAEHSLLVAGVPEAEVVAWWDRAVDVIPARAGKGVGVRALLDYYGIQASQAIAFGDGHNDMSMLREVGCGVAMGNAHADVKAEADAIARSADDDGVYWYLKECGLI